jgi:hypothetical protein
MTKEVIIKIANNRIEVKTSEGYMQTMNDIIILHNGKIISVGEITEEELKEEAKNMYATGNIVELQKIFNKSDEEIRQLKKLCKEDINNGTLKYWEKVKDEYEFIHAFNMGSLDKESILVFFKWIGLNIKNKIGGLLTRYIYHIEYLEFEKFVTEDRVKLKKEIMKVLPRIKSLEINIGVKD